MQAKSHYQFFKRGPSCVLEAYQLIRKTNSDSLIKEVFEEEEECEERSEKPAESLINFLSENDISTEPHKLAEFEELTAEVLLRSTEPDLSRLLKDEGWTGARYRVSEEDKMHFDQQSCLHALSNYYLRNYSSKHQHSRQNTGLGIGSIGSLLHSTGSDQTGHGSGSLTAAQVLDQVKPFCPDLLVNHLKSNPLLKNETEARCISFTGACMLADISGFSKFSASQCSKGVKGLDLLREATNGFLGHFVQEVYNCGGDVVAFAGDALICVFPVKQPAASVPVTPVHAASPTTTAAGAAGMNADESTFFFQKEATPARVKFVGLSESDKADSSSSSRDDRTSCEHDNNNEQLHSSNSSRRNDDEEEDGEDNNDSRNNTFDKLSLTVEEPLLEGSEVKEELRISQQLSPVSPIPRRVSERVSQIENKLSQRVSGSGNKLSQSVSQIENELSQQAPAELSVDIPSNVLGSPEEENMPECSLPGLTPLRVADFDSKAPDSLDCCYRAMQCAHLLRFHKTDYLSAHIGVSYGDMKLALLGGHEGEWTYVLNGECVSELASCIDDAKSQEFAVTAECFSRAKAWEDHLLSFGPGCPSVPGPEALIKVQAEKKSGNYLIESIAVNESLTHGLSNIGVPPSMSKDVSDISDVSSGIPVISANADRERAVKLLRQSTVAFHTGLSSASSDPFDLGPSPKNLLVQTHGSGSGSASGTGSGGSIGSGADLAGAANRISLLRKANSHRSQSADRELMVSISPFVPRPVLNAIHSEALDSLGELRQVTTMFLALLSYSPTVHTDPVTLQPFFLIAQQVLRESGGFLRQFLVDDKGCVFIAMWGVPTFTYANNGTRALYCAAKIRESVMELDHKCAIGITTGTVFCGSEGGNDRRDYAGIGSDVNVAARLMCKAPNYILLDQNTYQNLDAPTKELLEPGDELQLKGMSAPVRPWRYKINCGVLPKITSDEIFSEEGYEQSVLKSKIQKTLAFELDELCNASQGDNLDDLLDGTATSRFVFVMGVPGTRKGQAALYYRNAARRRNINCIHLVARNDMRTVPYGILQELFYELVGKENFSTLSQKGILLDKIVDELCRDAPEQEKVNARYSMEVVLGLTHAPVASTTGVADAVAVLTRGESIGSAATSGEVEDDIDQIDFAGMEDEEDPFNLSSRPTSLKRQYSHLSQKHRQYSRKKDDHSFYNVIGLLLRNQPTVIIIENAHHCDELSWDELLLLQRGRAMRLSVLCTMHAHKLHRNNNSLRSPYGSTHFGIAGSTFNLTDAVAAAAAASGGGKAGGSDSPSSTGTATPSRSDSFQQKQTAVNVATVTASLLESHAIVTNKPFVATTEVLADSTSSNNNNHATKAGVNRLKNLQVSIPSNDCSDSPGRSDPTPMGVLSLHHESTSSNSPKSKDSRNNHAAVAPAAAVVAVAAASHWRHKSIDMRDKKLAKKKKKAKKTKKNFSPRYSNNPKLSLPAAGSPGNENAGESSDSSSSGEDGNHDQNIDNSKTHRSKSGYSSQSDAPTTIYHMDKAPASWYVLLADPNTVVIELGEMSAQEVRSVLMQSIGNTEECSDELVGLVHELSSGNAFWCKVMATYISEQGAEEFLRAFKASDSRQNSLKQLILVRFETALTTDTQVALKVASIIGEEFSTRMLGAVIPTHLLGQLHSMVNKLVLKGFLKCITEYPDPVYRFQHPLVQTTIRELTTPRDAEPTHTAVAEFLEVTFADNLRPFYPLLAYHYKRGYRKKRNLAFKYEIKAADQAICVGAFSEGLTLLENAGETANRINELKIVIEVAECAFEDITECKTNLNYHTSTFRRMFRKIESFQGEAQVLAGFQLVKKEAQMKIEAEQEKKHSLRVQQLQNSPSNRLKTLKIQRSSSKVLTWQPSYARNRVSSRGLADGQQCESDSSSDWGGEGAVQCCTCTVS